MQTEGGLNSGSLQMAVLIYALYRRTENQWDEEPSCCSHKLIEIFFVNSFTLVR